MPVCQLSEGSSPGFFPVVPCRVASTDRNADTDPQHEGPGTDSTAANSPARTDAPVAAGAPIVRADDPTSVLSGLRVGGTCRPYRGRCLPPPKRSPRAGRAVILTGARSCRPSRSSRDRRSAKGRADTETRRPWTA